MTDDHVETPSDLGVETDMHHRPVCGNNSVHEATLNHVEPVTQAMSYDDEIKFRVGAEKEAVKILDDLRVGGVNISQLAREGFEEKLREALTDDDRIRIYEMYDHGEIDEDVARVFLGDDIDRIEEDVEAFESVEEEDTSQHLAG